MEGVVRCACEDVVVRPDETIDKAIDASEHRHILKEAYAAVSRKQCLYNRLNFCTFWLIRRPGNKTYRLAEQKIDRRIYPPRNIVLNYYLFSLYVLDRPCAKHPRVR